jgi:phosphohistidine phosphatase SixA
VVYLVRHAHAGKKAHWPGPDLDRPLSAQGHKEARGLIDRLGARPLGRILSSPARRWLQTVQPLAERLGRPVEPEVLLGVDGTGAGVLELLAGGELDQAVLCTHGEIIGEVFDELQRAGIELSGPLHWPKGSTWVLQLDCGQGWKGIYLEPAVARRSVGEGA